MSKTITVTIGADGSVQVETKGFAGASCLTETAALEAALGGPVDVEKTREFYQTQGQAATAKHG